MRNGVLIFVISIGFASVTFALLAIQSELRRTAQSCVHTEYVPPAP